MERSILALIGVTFLATACDGPEDGSMLQSDFQVATVDEPDGRVSLDSGHLIADALALGEDLESLSFMTAFLRVRVPRVLVDAPTELGQAVFISLEQANPGVEILLHQFDATTVVNGRATRMENTTFIPSDPWLTGRAQVLRDDPSGILVGGAHIVKYSGTLPLSSAEHIWGMASCAGQPGCPALRYENPDPCRWPLPLPASWTLEPLMGGPARTLDDLCSNM